MKKPLSGASSLGLLKLITSHTQTSFGHLCPRGGKTQHNHKPHKSRHDTVYIPINMITYIWITKLALIYFTCIHTQADIHKVIHNYTLTIELVCTHTLSCNTTNMYGHN